MMLVLYIGKEFSLFGGPTPEEIKKIKIIESSIRVDVVAMPKMTIQELKKYEAPVVEAVEEPAPAEVAKEEAPDPNAFQKEKKKVNFKDMLSQLSKKKVSKVKGQAKKRPSNTSSKRKSAFNKELKKLIVEGNKLGSGSSLVAEKTSELNGEFESYVASLPEKIRPFWKLPSYLLDRGYSCHLRLFLSSSGEVLKIEVYKTSGNKEYDDWAKDAVRKASPFAALGAKIAHRGPRGDIILGFPLQ
jgi:outer membrane biosynthesis protein TonB